MTDPTITEIEELRALKVDLIQQNNNIKQRLIHLEKENKEFRAGLQKAKDDKRVGDDNQKKEREEFSKNREESFIKIQEQDRDIKRLERELQDKEEERITQTEELKEMMAKQKDDMDNEISNLR